MTFTSKPSCWGDENEYDPSRSKCVYTCQSRRSCADNIIAKQATAVRDTPVYGGSGSFSGSIRSWDSLKNSALQAQAVAPVTAAPVVATVTQVNMAPVYHPVTPNHQPAPVVHVAPVVPSAPAQPTSVALAAAPVMQAMTTGLMQLQSGPLAASATTPGSLMYEKNQSSPGHELMVRAVLAGTVGVLEEVARFARNDGYRLLQRPKVVVKCAACGTINDEKAHSCTACKRHFH